MIVRIGVSDTPKELEVEMADDVDTDKVKADIEAALSGGDSVLWLADRHGRQVGVPSAQIAYVDLGTTSGGPRIGFGA